MSAKTSETNAKTIGGENGFRFTDSHNKEEPMDLEMRTGIHKRGNYGRLTATESIIRERCPVRFEFK